MRCSSQLLRETVLNERACAFCGGYEGVSFWSMCTAVNNVPFDNNTASCNRCRNSDMDFRRFERTVKVQ
jgi:hypothetical protein